MQYQYISSTNNSAYTYVSRRCRRGIDTKDILEAIRRRVHSVDSVEGCRWCSIRFISAFNTSTHICTGRWACYALLIGCWTGGAFCAGATAFGLPSQPGSMQTDQFKQGINQVYDMELGACMRTVHYIKTAERELPVLLR
jgi:hypothetical protein